MTLYYLEDISGDFEFTQIQSVYSYGYGRNLYEKGSKTVKCLSHISHFKVSILLNIEYKEVDLVKVEYILQFPGHRIELLDLFEFYAFSFNLPRYEYLKFNCCIRKCRGDKVMVSVKNPYDLRLNGKKENFEYETNCYDNINQLLSFIFDPSTVRNQKELSVESCLDSALSHLEKTFASKLSLYDILSDCKGDTVFISSDKKRIPSYKCVIQKHSKVLASILAYVTNNSSEIIIDDYDAETITAALDFCHGKVISFKEKEHKMSDILKFAHDFGFIELMVDLHFFMRKSNNNLCFTGNMLQLFQRKC
uniref:BTB domain-containing protein n=1 Tax=Panagrolaimus superbus TaxID=310955 RepID=A0A914Z119_9BILA